MMESLLQDTLSALVHVCMYNSEISQQSSFITICFEELTEADTYLSFSSYILQKLIELDLAFLKECAYPIDGSVVSNIICI